MTTAAAQKFSPAFLSYGHRLLITVGLLGSESDAAKTKVVDRGGMQFIIGKSTLMNSFT